jgi:hypothetical protein
MFNESSNKNNWEKSVLKRTSGGGRGGGVGKGGGGGRGRNDPNIVCAYE